MNLTAEMIPGLCLLLAGAFVTVFAERLCSRRANAPQLRMLGVFLAFAGALLVFIP